jgi:uncharacterized membrane protein
MDRNSGFCHTRRERWLRRNGEGSVTVFNGLLLLAIVVLSIPVSIIVLFVRTGRMREQIATLERRIADLTTQQRHGVPTSLPPPATLAAPGAPADPTVAPTRAVAADLTEPTLSPPPESAAIPGEVEARTAAPDLPASPQRPEAARPASREWSNRMADWLGANWIYVVAAASLSLAGIFFVQYGMERGLLPPGLRVLAAIVFGLALIGAGEWFRRRFGDEGLTSTIYLPSVFSGAGLVSIFAAVLAARQLYELIPAEVAFAGHLGTAALAVALGWFYGPLLAGVGLIGAAVSPFIVGGGSEASPWLYAYFALIAAVGLGIDAVRRWGWVSSLALVLGYAMSLLSYLSGAGEPGWVSVLLVLAVLAVILPRLQLIPSHPRP